MQNPMRLVAPGLAANAETYILDAPLCAVVGCMHCGGIKQVIQRIKSDWTMQQIEINEAYYRRELFPCVCGIDEVRARALLADNESLRETNLALAQEKLELERHIELLFAVERESGAHPLYGTATQELDETGGEQR